MSFWDFKNSARQVARHARQRDIRVSAEKILQEQQSKRVLKRRADKSIGDDLFLEIPSELKLTDDYIDCVAHNREFNDVYSDFYYRWYEDSNIARFSTLAQRVYNCHRFWNGDRYNLQRVFDVKTVNLCHDKFCVNCQHLKQASRLKRFTPVFEEACKDFDLYHLTVTVPNVTGEHLKETVDKLFEAFKKLIRYFSGDAKIRGLDFKQYGYDGAVRSLEIVTNPHDYHPHIHAAILLKKDLGLVKNIVVNPYSYDHGILVRKFSDLEILIQKIIFLIINGKKVQLDSISALPVGYSCILDPVEKNEWHEVFKYVTKLTDNGMPLLTDTQFRTLYTVLYRCKVMQGYGSLYRIAEDDEDDEEASFEYAKILAKLRAVEDPKENCSQILDEIVKNIHENNITYISKRQVQMWLNELAKNNKID